MTCEDLTYRLPEYWAGTLAGAPLRAFESHLETCPACREEARALGELWQALDTVTEQEPAGEPRAGAARPTEMAVLGDVAARPPVAAWTVRAQPLLQLAALLLILLIGFAAGRSWPDTAQHAALAEMRGELQGMRQMVALSLLREQSASERLRGVTWSAGMDQPSAEVTGALLDTLQRDGNVNVRLAAIEALRQFGGDARVRQALVRALPTDPSPLVQIALIDAMVTLKEPGSADALRLLSGDPRVNESVRQRARRGLQQIL